MLRISSKALFLAMAVVLFAGGYAQAQSPRWELGIRPAVLVGDGVPSNDMLGVGFVLRYDRTDDWTLGFGLDQYQFDFEEPYKHVGLAIPPGSKAIDSKMDSTIISAWLERRYGDNGQGWSWFWTAGIGYAFLDATIASGPTDTGGTFTIVTDPSDEFQLHASLGARWRFAGNWAFETAALAQVHFADYWLEDLESGSTGSIGTHTPIGVNLGLSYRFN